ncbi:unnamed protein product [Rotaria sordida]|nr:unnamed protein product [Rotaria sordida]CAF1150742.1 unnamed protein product [Rotaria sordida]
MNTTALDKYNQMRRKLEHVNNSVRTMNDTNCTKMLSTHTQLNEIEDAMSNLESTIMHLDAYSRSLETQVKKFEKTFLATRTMSPTKD